MEAIEAADFDGETRCMPFRLTSNFVEFIGQTGLHGLFAGVMTSCSLAISGHSDKLHCFLALALKDELLPQPQEQGASA
jgi:phosphatidylinositol kinase/protein kinase (PI-3  family)